MSEHAQQLNGFDNLSNIARTISLSGAAVWSLAPIGVAGLFVATPAMFADSVRMGIMSPDTYAQRMELFNEHATELFPLSVVVASIPMLLLLLCTPSKKYPKRAAVAVDEDDF